MITRAEGRIEVADVEYNPHKRTGLVVVMLIDAVVVESDVTREVIIEAPT